MNLIAILKTPKKFILLFLFVAQINTAQNYDPNFFPIGVWSVKGDFRSVDDFLFNLHTAGQYHQTSFHNLKSQGFNSVFLSYDPIGPTLDTILKIAESYDMKVISSMQHLYEVVSQSNYQTVTDTDIIQAIEADSINRLKASSAVLGYYLYDEPLPGWIDFNVLQNARNILTQMTSDAPHPILSCWNDEQHMDTLNGYLNLDVLMMDTYPFEDGDAYGDISDYMPSYFYDGPGSDPMPYSDYINLVRQNHCDATNKPLWVVLQAFGDLETPDNGGYWRQVYPKEIRLEVYLAIMNGAKGIWYFLYESEYPYLLGLLDVSGQPTQRLTEVTAVNYELQALSNTLLKLKVYDNQTAISTSEGKAVLHYDNASNQHYKYVIAVNTDVNNISTPAISINKNDIGYQVSSVINMLNNQTVPYTETANQIIITPTIDVGNGLVLKLSDQTADIENTHLANQIEIFPNPTTNFIHINSGTLTILAYSLYDFSGKKIMENKTNVNNLIDMRALSKGIYYIKIQTKTGDKTLKVIKE